MDIRTETKTTYGLRDRSTGKFLLLDIVDNNEGDAAGAESVRLTLETWGGQAPRYEVADMMDLIRTLKENRQWYESSRQRPSWNGFGPDRVIPAVIETELDFDTAGGDPIATRTRINTLQFPPRYQGTVGRMSRDVPEDILLRTFGEAYTTLLATQSGNWEDAVYLDTVTVDLSEGPKVGMVVETPDRSTGQIEAIAEMPSDWPDHHIDLSNPDLRVALIRLNRMRPYEAPRPFSTEDFETRAEAPSP